jgi:hypothetical protein
MLVLYEAGYGLYAPFGENTRCDLIIERNDRLLRVQCKTGRLRKGAIRFAVCSVYAHHPHPKVIFRTYDGEIDAFAVYCPETTGVYLVPIDDIDVTRSCGARDYEIGTVAIGGLRAPSDA